MGSIVKTILKHGGKVNGLSMHIPNDANNYSNNPTIANWNGRLVVNMRKNPYYLISLRNSDRVEFVTYGKDIYSFNTIGYLDNINKFKTLIPGPGPYKIMGKYTGMEDMRLVVWDNDLYGILSRPDVVPNKVVMQLIRFNEMLDMVDTWVFETPNYFEKNWLPIQDKPFNFLYDPATGACIELNIANYKEADDVVAPTIINQINPPSFSGGLCGSSQVMPYKDGYICLCHSRYDWVDTYKHVYYTHQFVVYDKNMKPVSVSKPFNFFNKSVEYCCGLESDGENIYITFSLHDGVCGMLTIPISEFDSVVDYCFNKEMEYFSEEEVEDVIASMFVDWGDNDKYVASLCYLTSRNEELIYNAVKEYKSDYHIWKPLILKQILKSKYDTPWLLKLIEKN